MHPQEIRVYLDHIYDKFMQVFEENTKLRRENKMLQEEIGKLKGYPAVKPVPIQHNQQGIPPRYQQPPIKIHKMGADWHIEGDLLLQISLGKKLQFPAPICNVRMSKQGQIAFTCNRKIFLLNKDRFYLVEDKMTPFNPSSMTKDLTENFRCIFEFVDENLIVFYKNSLIKFTDLERIWVMSMPGVYHMAVHDGLLYIGTRDMKIHVFRDNEFLESYDHKEPFKFFSVTNGIVVGFNEFRVSAVGRHNVLNEGGRIISLDSNHSMIFFGGESSVLKICKLTNNSIEVIDTIMFKKIILSIKALNGLVIVSTQDKCLSVCNLAHRKNMRIIGTENVIDIAANDQMIACVDNTGALKIWKLLEE